MATTSGHGRRGAPRRLLGCAILLLACAVSPSGRARVVRESDGRDLAGCAFVGTFSGHASLAGVLPGASLQSAKDDVLDSAAAKGATHVVWRAVSSGWGSTVAANAFRCERS